MHARDHRLRDQVHLPASASAFASVLPALYFACTGHSGTQLLLPWQRPPLDLVGADGPDRGT